MADRASLEADIAAIDRWLADPAAVRELMVELPSLVGDAEARGRLSDLRAALEDVKAGRTVSHDVIVDDVAARRRGYRVSAAE